MDRKSKWHSSFFARFDRAFRGRKHHWMPRHLGCQIRQIQFVTKDQGRPTGECFVIMQSGEDVQLAKTYDKRLISNRRWFLSISISKKILLQGYIEVFQSNSDEMAQMLRKINSNEILSPLMNSPMDSQWKEPVVRLRGLPYNATKDDVKNFFTGRFEELMWGVYWGGWMGNMDISVNHKGQA